MLNVSIALLAIVLTITLVVGVHELGHFLAARWVGVKVLRFSIGFGKKLYQWHDKKGTEFILAAIPLGGYVKLLGENNDTVSPDNLAFAYQAQPFFKKFIIVAMGPLFNFLFAFLIYWSLFVIGFMSLAPVTGQIIQHSIADKAGVKANQEIIRVDHKKTHTWISIVIRILEHTGNKDILTIATKDLTTKKSHTYTLNLSSWQMDELKPDPLTSLGIQPAEPSLSSLKYIKYDPAHAMVHAWQNTIDFSYMNFLTIEKLLTGKASLRSLGGPISIFTTAGSSLIQGLIPFFSFLAFLSISIGVLNILPIPGLDGGHILFQSIEAFLRRPISPDIQLFSLRLGFIMLFFLIIHAIINDILRFI